MRARPLPVLFAVVRPLVLRARLARGVPSGPHRERERGDRSDRRNGHGRDRRRRWPERRPDRQRGGRRLGRREPARDDRRRVPVREEPVAVRHPRQRLRRRRRRARGQRPRLRRQPRRRRPCGRLPESDGGLPHVCGREPLGRRVGHVHERPHADDRGGDELRRAARAPLDVWLGPRPARGLHARRAQLRLRVGHGLGHGPRLQGGEERNAGPRRDRDRQRRRRTGRLPPVVRQMHGLERSERRDRSEGHDPRPDEREGVLVRLQLHERRVARLPLQHVQRLVHRLPVVEGVQRREPGEHLVRHGGEHDQRQQQLLPGVHGRRADRMRRKHAGDLRPARSAPASSRGPASPPTPRRRRTARAPRARAAAARTG